MPLGVNHKGIAHDGIKTKLIGLGPGCKFNRRDVPGPIIGKVIKSNSKGSGR